MRLLFRTTIAVMCCSALSLTAAKSEISDATDAGSARFDRTTLVIRDMQESLSFWRDVMQFEVVRQPITLPSTENQYLGWSSEATVTFAGLVSPDGAGVGLLEVSEDGFADLNIKRHPTGHGGVVLVMIAKNIEILYERALEADAVLKPLGLSPTGRSKQMYLNSPSGHVLEVYEVLPKT